MNTIATDLATVADACLRSLPEAPLLAALLEGTLTCEEYLAWGAQTYHYTHQTCALSSLAATELDGSGRYPRLVEPLLHVHREERGLDRQVLADMAALGGHVAPARLPSPTRAIDAYVTWNRAVILTGAPVAFLGTAYVLASLAARSSGAAAARLLDEGRIRGIGRAIGFLQARDAAGLDLVAAIGAALFEVTAAEDRDQILLSAEVTAALFPLFFAAAEPVRRLSAA